MFWKKVRKQIKLNIQDFLIARNSRKLIIVLVSLFILSLTSSIVKLKNLKLMAYDNSLSQT